MNHLTKTLSLIIALLCALPSLAGCGDTATETTPAAAVEETVVETQAEAETTRAQTKDNLPEIDLGGLTVPILYRGCPADVIEVYAEELTGEPVSDAIYNRNLSVCERLNIQFDFIPNGTHTAAEFPAEAIASIAAGSDDFSIISWQQAQALKQCLFNRILDLNGSPYLDYDMPWWNNDYMDVMQIGEDKRFFLVGDICLNTLRSTSVVYYNHSLYENLFGDPNDLYELVLEGGWTLEQYFNMTEAAYVDTDGNGKANEGDIFGSAATTVSNTEMFAYGAGFQVAQRDASGLPVLVVNSEKNFDILSRLSNLFWNNIGLTTKYDDNQMYNSTVVSDLFSANQMLFMPLWLKTCENLREMESVYGIIPYPKFDENQKEYLSLVHNCASVFCIPVTSRNADDICAILEAMCAENYRTVMPAYYDVALKRQYARDDISAQMIDLIHDTSMTDFGYAYSSSIGGLGVIGRDIVGSKKDAASTIQSKYSAGEAGLTQLIETYLGIAES